MLTLDINVLIEYNKLFSCVDVCVCMYLALLDIFPCKFISGATPPANQNGWGPQNPNQEGVIRVYIYKGTIFLMLRFPLSDSTAL